MPRFFLATACVGLLTALCDGQDAVTIKPPSAAKAGEKVRVTETEKSKTVMDFVIAGEKSRRIDEDSRSVVYVQEVVTAAGKDGKPLKLKRTYEKYDATDEGKPAPGPPLDAVIVIEKKGDKYTFDAGDQKLDAAFLKKLDGEYNRPDAGADPLPDLLPTRPVKAGDTWKLPAKKLLLDLDKGADGPKLDFDKMTSAGKVLKVYRKGGERFVVLEMTFGAPMLSLGKDAPKLSEGSMSAKLTIDFCADRTTPTGTTVSLTKMSATLNDPLISGTFSFEQTTNTIEESLNK